MTASLKVSGKGTVKVSCAGALSIPKPILEAIAVEPGAEFSVERDGYGLRLVPLRPFPTKSVDEVAGCLHRPGRKKRSEAEVKRSIGALLKDGRIYTEIDDAL